jgi:hypothetical protein
MRVKKALLFIGLCSAIFTFSSCTICSKKVPCPPFNDDILPIWFPYKDETRLSFTAAATGATQSFTLDTVLMLSNTVYQNEKDHCSASRQGESIERDANGQPAFSFRLIKNGYYDATETRQMSMKLLGLEISSPDVRRTEFRQLSTPVKNTYVQNLASVNLDGKTFYNLLLVRMDTAGTVKPPVHKIYFAENLGIVAYETYSPALRWVRQ